MKSFQEVQENTDYLVLDDTPFAKKKTACDLNLCEKHDVVSERLLGVSLRS